MKGSQLLMTEQEVINAIYVWYNKISPTNKIGGHKISYVRALPHSENFCLKVQFEDEDG